MKEHNYYIMRIAVRVNFSMFHEYTWSCEGQGENSLVHKKISPYLVYNMCCNSPTFVVCYPRPPLPPSLPSPRYMESTLSAATLELSVADMADIEAVLKCSEGPGGHVYGLERERKSLHGAIMRYNLNQVNGAPHLEELCRR